MNEARIILGMDIGGTNVRSGFVDSANRVTDFAIRKTADIFTGDSPQNLVDYVAGLLKNRKEPPLAVSIGLPSTVDRTNRIVYSTPNIKGLDNVDIASRIEAACHIPVYVVRDVCLLLLYDIHYHHLKKDGFILGFYIGTGLGNAICMNGELVVGKNGVAGELGHIPVVGKTGICGCGNQGCIELYASGKRLTEIRDAGFPNQSIKDILVNHSSDTVIEEFIDTIAIAIASEITILDPEEVILGGGVIMQDDFPRDKLEGAIKRHARKPYPANNLNFIYTKESNENGVIGAGIFGLQKISARRNSADLRSGV
ncbi:D-allose kinase [Spirochaetia bacterium]|nr:D-allose kinase [Spirochaetia bacterium]